VTGRSFRLRARPRAIVPLACLALALPRPAAGQRILGGGADAVTLPRGSVRVALGAEHTMQRDRWRDGTLEGLGGNLTTDAFGRLQFSTLASVELLVRTLGDSTFAASLGSTRLEARQRMFVTPLAIEYGVADWLTLRARATLVRAKAEARFTIRTDSGRANLGINPIALGSGVAAQNTSTIAAYALASTNLLARITACQGNAAAHPECPTILAELGAAQALRSATGNFAAQLAQLYGTTTSDGQRFVPLAGSAAESTLVARADALRAALVRYGVTDVTVSTGLPASAGVPVGGEELARIVRDTSWGYGYRRLNDAGLTQVGDVHLGAVIRLHDGLAARGTSRFAADARGWRQALLVEGRIGTSYPPRADRLLDQGTGSGTHAVTVRAITDLVPSSRWWATLAVGYTVPFARDATLRVPGAAGQVGLEAWRTGRVSVAPGGELDVELSPRWMLGDYLALGGTWQWRRHAADRHEYSVTSVAVGGVAQVLDATLLDAPSAFDEHRVGLTATYSTLAAQARGRRGMPFEISYVHQQSVASGTGVVPKQWQDLLVIRYYARFRAR